MFEVVKGSERDHDPGNFRRNNGSDPNGGLIEDSAGNLYGTTVAGGAQGVGTVFEVAAGSGIVTTLVSADSSNAANPSSELVMDSAGNLYGTSNNGGGNGSIFEVAKGSGVFTVLASLATTPGAGSTPAMVMDVLGDLYGTTTTTSTGAGNGAVFEWVKATKRSHHAGKFPGIGGHRRTELDPVV